MTRNEAILQWKQTMKNIDLNNTVFKQFVTNDEFISTMKILDTLLNFMIEEKRIDK